MSGRESGRTSPLPLVLAGAAFALAAYTLYERVSWRPYGKAEPRSVEARGDLADFEKTSVGVFESVSPAVVHIASPERVTGRDVWGRIYGYPAGTGTGFVWDDNGYIVTNWHVVKERPAVLVRFADGREHEAVVIGRAPDQDIAVVKLVSLPPGLRPIPKVGGSSDLKVGQAVFAIGNPFGYDQSLTTGIISALNRTIRGEQGEEIDGCIQVDAAINPGNSGGPLLDSAGRLIGMNTAIYSPSGASAGIGFAIPVDAINQAVPRLIDPNKRAPTLGIRAQPSQDGVVVSSVVRGSGAEEAGLVGQLTLSRGLGDIIIAVDGKPVRSVDDIGRILSARKVGDTVTVQVIRGLPYDEHRVDVPVTLR
ncbi:MAG: trypsin-like peptidase domain-containing protein [Planctomycetota bacterium]